MGSVAADSKQIDRRIAADAVLGWKEGRVGFKSGGQVVDDIFIVQVPQAEHLSASIKLKTFNNFRYVIGGIIGGVRPGVLDATTQ